MGSLNWWRSKRNGEKGEENGRSENGEGLIPPVVGGVFMKSQNGP